MRLSIKLLVAPALALLAVTPALAQRSSPPTASQVTPSHPAAPPLYQNPEIARSLDLTQDQISRLNQATERLSGRYRDELGRLNRLDERERASRTDELARTYRSDLMRSYGDVFNERQMARYRQLDLQSRGLGAFTDADIQRRLELREEQLRRLRALEEENARKLRELRPGTAAPKDDNTLRGWQDFRRNMIERTDRILDERQRRTWRELTGDPYEFGPSAPRGPGSR